MTLPKYPTLKRDIIQLLEHASRAALAQRTELFKESPRFSQHEGSDMVFVVEGEETKIEYQKMAAEKKYTVDEIKSMTPDQIIQDGIDIGQKIGDQQMKHSFAQIEKAVNTSGNVVKSNKVFGYDQFLDALDMLDINFNDDGTPDMPTMVVNHETAKLIQKMKDDEETPEQKARHESIMKQKRIDYDARESRRKLVD